jgi:voltage-gated potassium channel
VSTRLETRINTWTDRLTLVRAIGTIIGIAVALVLVAGFLVWLVERETFTSIGLAYWWAMETVTTVGYGDVVPHSVSGRVIASMLMLTGLALIPTLTSVIVSTLLAKHRQEEQAQLADMLRSVEKRLADLEDDQ